MKISHLIAIGVILAAIGVLVSSSKDFTTYATFAQASASGQKVKLVGELVKDRAIEYNPENNPDFMSFFLKDEKGEVRQVLLRAAKPQDFERSEQIVLTGVMKGDVFEANDMLLKCPSKYKDQETYVREKEI